MTLYAHDGVPAPTLQQKALYYSGRVGMRQGCLEPLERPVDRCDREAWMYMFRWRRIDSLFRPVASGHGGFSRREGRKSPAPVPRPTDAARNV